MACSRVNFTFTVYYKTEMKKHGDGAKFGGYVFRFTGSSIGVLLLFAKNKIQDQTDTNGDTNVVF